METVKGVQELIDKLQTQGVAAGQNRADQIVKEAERQADQIVAAAKSQADQLYAEAKHKIDLEKKGAHESIKLAFRDAELVLRTKFREAFSNYLKRLVSYETQDKEFIKTLILTIVGSNASQREIQVPDKSLSHLLLGMTTEMLREGVDIKPSAEFQGGIRVKLVGEDMLIDLSDDALSELLLNYLLPRYRAIVTGQENG
jgi:V/A-type H+/Na+-transporting ATPase subunit E